MSCECGQFKLVWGELCSIHSLAHNANSQCQGIIQAGFTFFVFLNKQIMYEKKKGKILMSSDTPA